MEQALERLRLALQPTMPHLVIFAYGEGKKPTEPHLLLSPVSSRRVGTPETKEGKILFQKELLISVQIFGFPADPVKNWLEADGNVWGLVRTSQVRTITSPVGYEWEEKYQLDVTLSVVETLPYIPPKVKAVIINRN